MGKASNDEAVSNFLEKTWLELMIIDFAGQVVTFIDNHPSKGYASPETEA